MIPFNSLGVKWRANQVSVFLRKWMRYLDVNMDCELCFRSNSGKNVSFYKICISFAAKAECYMVNETEDYR